MAKRVLLDENLSYKLRLLLAGHIVITSAYQRVGRKVERGFSRNASNNYREWSPEFVQQARQRQVVKS